MYLLDTDVISEARKGEKANPGVRAFLREATQNGTALFLSVISIGELRRGVEVIRYRGDGPQAARLERWLNRVSSDFEDAILPFDHEAAHVWGRLRAPNAENPLDKQIAATALIHDLSVVTRNVSHYQATGARLLNPFG
jgi:predicted nucleic acid-binding protein